METSKLYMKGMCITKDYLKTLIKSMFHKVTDHTPLLNIHKPLMVLLKPVGIDRLCTPDRVSSLQLIGIKGDRKVLVCTFVNGLDSFRKQIIHLVHAMFLKATNFLRKK